MKALKNLSDADKRFWSSIAIGSGITIFAFGSSLFPDITWIYLRGWVTCIVGIILLMLGFTLVFVKKTKSDDKLDVAEQPTKESEDTGQSDKEYEDYLIEERKSLVIALLEETKSFDRWILTLAGGTFGLSLAFINQIASNPKSGITFLGIAWASFAVSILLTLISFLSSQEACYKQVETVDKLITKELDRKRRLSLNLFSKFTKGLNWFSMVMFIVGVIFLITFAIKNLN
jgi:uncharacterized ion transporter superfamily protein YfcC